jgi:hypothetical protein
MNVNNSLGAPSTGSTDGFPTWDTRAIRCAGIDKEREMWMGMIEKNPSNEALMKIATEKLEALHTKREQILLESVMSTPLQRLEEAVHFCQNLNLSNVMPVDSLAKNSNLVDEIQRTLLTTFLGIVHDIDNARDNAKALDAKITEELAKREQEATKQAEAETKKKQEDVERAKELTGQEQEMTKKIIRQAEADIKAKQEAAKQAEELTKREQEATKQAEAETELRQQVAEQARAEAELRQQVAKRAEELAKQEQEATKQTELRTEITRAKLARERAEAQFARRGFFGKLFGRYNEEDDRNSGE